MCSNENLLGERHPPSCLCSELTWRFMQETGSTGEESENTRGMFIVRHGDCTPQSHHPLRRTALVRCTTDIAGAE